MCRVFLFFFSLCPCTCPSSSLLSYHLPKTCQQVYLLPWNASRCENVYAWCLVVDWFPIQYSHLIPRVTGMTTSPPDPTQSWDWRWSTYRLWINENNTMEHSIWPSLQFTQPSGLVVSLQLVWTHLWSLSALFTGSLTAFPHVSLLIKWSAKWINVMSESLTKQKKVSVTKV